jgi:hypothetical protein
VSVLGRLAPQFYLGFAFSEEGKITKEKKVNKVKTN